MLKLKNKNMNKILIILPFLMLISCYKETTTRKYTVTKSDDGGWSMGANIKCDSVTMISDTEAYYWRDGQRSKLIGKRINIYTNE